MNLLSIRSINPDRYLSAALAIYFARLALPVWKRKYPKDSRPEGAIEAAEKALFADAACAAASASAAAYAAASAGDAVKAAYADAHADVAATNAAYAAASANAAARAARAIASASANAAYVAANAAANAASNAAYSAVLGKDERLFIHHHLTQLLPLFLWHKMNSKRSFADPEKLFELLPEACKEDFLFNLDSLR